jgi:antitoxin component of RelBE/YafQ-DinJ toxin-antitoxin module
MKSIMINFLNVVDAYLDSQYNAIERGEPMKIKTVNVSFDADEEILEEAKIIFSEKGIDLATGLNLCLNQFVSNYSVPSDKVIEDNYMSVFLQGTFTTDKLSPTLKAKREEMFNKFGGLAHPAGCLKGEIWISEDFDEPVEYFEDEF